MAKERGRSGDRRLDLAARAAWLYFVGGNTQDEIAVKLNTSRQSAQRLVSLAVSEKLIKFRLDHPGAAAFGLAEALRERWGLDGCEVVPLDATTEFSLSGIAVAAADFLETFLAQTTPQILAFSTGRTLRAVVDEVAAMSCPQHKLVSVVGAMSRDGRASPYEVVMRLAERTGAACYPMPTPVVASSVEERRLLQTQLSFATLSGLAERADLKLFGLSCIGWGSPLHADGFVTDDEMSALIERGGVGELCGCVFDVAGNILEGGTNERIAGLPLHRPARPRTLAVGGGAAKVAAFRGALRGRLITGLITDERTAAALLAVSRSPIRG